jgi:glycine/D-amino acid oxidase-like deaminating enzyme
MAPPDGAVAETTISLTVTLRTEGDARDWKTTIAELRAVESDVMLARPMRPEEIPPGIEDPWWQGGVAILDRGRIPNGHALAGHAAQAAMELLARLRRCAEEVTTDERTTA